MAVKTQRWLRREDEMIPTNQSRMHYICDTVAELPDSAIAGSCATALDTNELYHYNGTAWRRVLTVPLGS